MSTSLSVEGVSLRYGDRLALNDVSLSVPAGGRLAVVGRSGAGKTSLLRIVAGLAAPDGGVVRLGDQVATRGPERVTPPEDRRVSLVFQELALWPHMSVEKTLTWVARGESPADRRDTARSLAERVGLGKRLAAFPRELSGGEQQRLALARALASEPTLLLLDEPFAHLDAPLRNALISDLQTLLEARQTAVVLVTHQRETAVRLAEQLVILDGGRVQDAGDTESLLERPGSRLTVELLGLGTVIEGSVESERLNTPLGSLVVSGSSDGPAAALVRPEQVELLSEGQDSPRGVVHSCTLARPDSRLHRYDVRVDLGETQVRASCARAWSPGAPVYVRVTGLCSRVGGPGAGRA